MGVGLALLLDLRVGAKVEVAAAPGVLQMVARAMAGAAPLVMRRRC